jgi:hypothetical protein
MAKEYIDPVAHTGKGYYSTTGIQSQDVDDRGPVAVDLAHNAMEEAAQLALRVESLVDRLCGSVPVPVGGIEKSGPPGSVFSMLRERSVSTTERIRAANGALNRLDREIP